MHKGPVDHVPQPGYDQESFLNVTLHSQQWLDSSLTSLDRQWTNLDGKWLGWTKLCTVQSDQGSQYTTCRYTCN